MGKILFYHLTRSRVEETLDLLIGKSRQAGWRVAVRARAQERLEWLDEILWNGPKEGFDAHGIAGGPHDAQQPVLLTLGDVANGASCLILVDGAEVGPAEADAFERVCILFDGNDQEAVVKARAQWKQVKESGAEAEYWSQEDGPWGKKAET